MACPLLRRAAVTKTNISLVVQYWNHMSSVWMWVFHKFSNLRDTYTYTYVYVYISLSVGVSGPHLIQGSCRLWCLS